MESKLRLAFVLASFWLILGLLLDLFYAMRLDFYMLDPIRREVWRLAHAHGILMMLFYIVFYKFHGFKDKLNENSAFAGAFIMPMGFFIGGLQTTETDPSLGIFLVPLGALLFIGGILHEILGSRKRTERKRKG